MSCDLTANGYHPTNDYILDLAGAQMTEMAINQGNDADWQHTNVMADGVLIATYDLTGLHFYANDPLGTRRVQTDASAVTEQTCLSLPFGDQLNCTISRTGPTEQHFTGKERDTESTERKSLRQPRKGRQYNYEDNWVIRRDNEMVWPSSDC